MTTFVAGHQPKPSFAIGVALLATGDNVLFAFSHHRRHCSCHFLASTSILWGGQPPRYLPLLMIGRLDLTTPITAINDFLIPGGDTPTFWPFFGYHHTGGQHRNLPDISWPMVTSAAPPLTFSSDGHRRPALCLSTCVHVHVLGCCRHPRFLPVSLCVSSESNPSHSISLTESFRPDSVGLAIWLNKVFPTCFRSF